jgi:hypothetical protein
MVVGGSGWVKQVICELQGGMCKWFEKWSVQGGAAHSMSIHSFKGWQHY